MNWFILTIANVVLISFARILQKKLLNINIVDPIGFSIVFQLFTFVFVLIFALMRGFNLSGYIEFWPNIILMSFLYCFGGIFIAKAFKYTSASNVAILFSSGSIWSLFASNVFLGETINLDKIVGTVLIIIAILILQYKEKFSKLSKGDLYALLAAIFFGIAFANDAYTIGSKDVPSFLSLAFLLPGLLTAIIFPTKIFSALSIITSKGSAILLFIISIMYAAAAVSIFNAYQSGGDVSIIYPISQTSTILITILSIAIFNEKKKIITKILASITAVIGVTILGM